MQLMNQQKEIRSVAFLFGSLPVLKFQLLIEIAEPELLPPFLGSAFRGLLGWEMKRLVCPYKGKANCDGCLISAQCPYHLLIEKKMEAPEIHESPKGYVFYSPFVEGKQIRKIEVTLFGDCAKMVPVVTKAVFDGQQTGLGKGRNQYRIIEWREISPREGMHALPLDSEACFSMKGPFPLSDWVLHTESKQEIIEVLFETPLRLRRGGKYLSSMDWGFFSSIVIRRLESLNVLFNAGTALGKENYSQLLGELAQIDILSEKMVWRDLSRYSSRQKTKVPLGGLVGQLKLKIENEMVYQYLKATSLVHAGKGATMGLGKITVI
jgi:hypothetical protein